MPCILPEWLVKAVNALTRLVGHVTTVPPVVALLERARAWVASPVLDGDLAEDEAEKLMLALYWVAEYYQRRVSPTELLAVLRHLLTNLDGGA